MRPCAATVPGRASPARRPDRRATSNVVRRLADDVVVHTQPQQIEREFGDPRGIRTLVLALRRDGIRPKSLPRRYVTLCFYFIFIDAFTPVW